MALLESHGLYARGQTRHFDPAAAIQIRVPGETLFEQEIASWSRKEHHYGGYDQLGTDCTHICSQRPRRSLPGKGCRPCRGVLYAASRLHARASATARVCERVAWRDEHPAERARSVRLAADAGRATPGAWRVEPRGVESLGPSRLYCRSQERRRALPKRDGNWSRRTPDSDR